LNLDMKRKICGLIEPVICLGNCGQAKSFR
jgi:NADH:ubiquinone oxidoreductase subunit E